MAAANSREGSGRTFVECGHLQSLGRAELRIKVRIAVRLACRHLGGCAIVVAWLPEGSLCGRIVSRFPLSFSPRHFLPWPCCLCVPHVSHAQEPRLLVAQKGESSLAIVDPVDGRVLGSVAEGGVTGHEVIASADGRTAYVPIYGNSGVGKPGTDGTKIVAIDIASQKIVGDGGFRSWHKAALPADWAERSDALRDRRSSTSRSRSLIRRR